MKRHGAVIVFKPEVSEAAAAMALNQIRHVLDLPEIVMSPSEETQKNLDGGAAVRYRPEDWITRPHRMTDSIETFDDTEGHPCWYIP
jgi:hypothetical protein